MTYHFKNGDIDPYAAPKAKVDALRWKHFSYVMQGSMSLLNPLRRIRSTFEDFAFRPMGLPANQFWTQVEAHLQRLELAPNVLSAYPHQLSGGMRQRVAIALATVCEPEFVIADEPTTALDVVVQKDVLAMIRDVQRKIGSSVVFVTHDMSVHANTTDRVGIIYAGRLVEEAPTRTLFATPRHPYTAHLVAALPRIGDTTPKPALEGRPPNLAEPPTGCRFHPRCPLAIEKCKTEVPPLEPVGLDHRSACWRSADVPPLPHRPRTDREFIAFPGHAGHPRSLALSLASADDARCSRSLTSPSASSWAASSRAAMSTPSSMPISRCRPTPPRSSRSSASPDLERRRWRA